MTCRAARRHGQARNQAKHSRATEPGLSYSQKASGLGDMPEGACMNMRNLGELRTRCRAAVSRPSLSIE
jgi:hypothetical protein